MPLTDLQRSRIEFHCDLDSTRGLLALSFNIKSTSFSEVKLLQIVGQLVGADPDNLFVYEGVSLCTLTSALGACELAHSKLSPQTIDDSLLVRSAGKVNLRSDELKARRQLYNQTVEYLKQLIGLNSDSASRASINF
jgi:hypothetical protein